jgi:Uma2 family endonuclease
MAIRRAPRSVTDQALAEVAEPSARLFTVDEYYRMAEVGILRPDERVELIEGVVVQMPPIGPDHAGSVDSLNETFGDRLRPRVRVRVQNPIRLDGMAEPEPDITLLRPESERRLPYRSSHPTLEDLFLVVEVSDSTLAYDLGEKAAMYSRAGVPDLWIIDVNGDRIVVHREPTADGYASVTPVERGMTISPLAFPDVEFTADEVLG